jgi:hypothetical protein
VREKGESSLSSKKVAHSPRTPKRPLHLSPTSTLPLHLTVFDTNNPGGCWRGITSSPLRPLIPRKSGFTRTVRWPLSPTCHRKSSCSVVRQGILKSSFTCAYSYQFTIHPRVLRPWFFRDARRSGSFCTINRLLQRIRVLQVLAQGSFK